MLANINRDMKHIKLYNQWLSEKITLPKNTYIELSASDAAEYSDEIIDLINKSYSHVGGNLELRSANDIRNGDVSYWILKDIDDDPDPEIAIGGKNTANGKKITVMSQDGSSSAKKDVILKVIELMKTRGFYAEIDVNMAQKFGLAAIRNEKKVRDILKKDLEWHNDGSYTRSIKGEPHVKIMVGIPK